MTSKIAVLALAASAFFSNSVHAHTWVEEIQAISDTGSYTGDYGYPRGYVTRTDPAFTGDSNLWLLPALSSGHTRITDQDLVCKDTQRTPNTNARFPNLQITPGSYAAMKYLENGHVTLPGNQPGKPQAGGTVFVYGTTQPSSTETISDVLQWTADGSGGNKKGFLMTAQNYDDGRCHQINTGAISQQRQKTFPNHMPNDPNDTNPVELWCETDVQVPATAQPGSTLTVYWVWQWPTASGIAPGLPAGKDEYYTSCSDFDIVAGPLPDTQIHTLGQQDPMMTAVADFKSRTAVTSIPKRRLRFMRA
ncbi:hypothetical protein LTR28_004327 [Elasticomyces elasticus]|nr:hypothetical protein LTR28_004327 [Elasticomyces elasticus]